MAVIDLFCGRDQGEIFSQRLRVVRREQTATTNDKSIGRRSFPQRPAYRARAQKTIQWALSGTENIAFNCRWLAFFDTGQVSTSFTLTFQFLNAKHYRIIVVSLSYTVCGRIASIERERRHARSAFLEEFSGHTWIGQLSSILTLNDQHSKTY